MMWPCLTLALRSLNVKGTGCMQAWVLGGTSLAHHPITGRAQPGKHEVLGADHRPSSWHVAVGEGRLVNLQVGRISCQLLTQLQLQLCRMHVCMHNLSVNYDLQC